MLMPCGCDRQVSVPRQAGPVVLPVPGPEYHARRPALRSNVELLPMEVEATRPFKIVRQGNP